MIHGLKFNLKTDHPETNFGSYAQNGPKSKSLYLLAKIYAAEFDWLLLANQIQATWSSVSINCSSQSNWEPILAKVIENVNLSQIIKLISCFFKWNYTQRKKLSIFRTMLFAIKFRTMLKFRTILFAFDWLMNQSDSAIFWLKIKM